MLLFCLGNLDSVLASPIGPISPITQVSLRHPAINHSDFLQIFVNSTGNVGLGVFMAAISTYLAFAGGADAMGGCARTLWALSRDGAFLEALARVHPTLDARYGLLSHVPSPKFF